MKTPLLLLLSAALGASALDVPISTVFTSPDPDFPAFVATSKSIILAGNDGSAATGGVKAFSLTESGSSPLWDKRTGRTKVAGSIGDWIVTLSQEDYFLRAISPDGKQVEVLRKVWGDPSALCTWNSDGRWYVYLLGKREGRIISVGKKKKGLEAVEVC